MQDEETTRIVNAVYRMAFDWQRSKPKLTVNPKLPKQLKNRVADNWRPLMSIADSFGEAWGDKARDAAITFASAYHDEETVVILLSDLREMFGRTNWDRAASEQLIAELHDLADGMWLEYRGVRDDQPPRKLNTGRNRAVAPTLRQQAALCLAARWAERARQKPKRLLPSTV
jgi:hypothetical protein